MSAVHVVNANIKNDGLFDLIQEAYSILILAVHNGLQSKRSSELSLNGDMFYG